MRLIAGAQFGLGSDEAHYVMYSRYLDWSYFDHPPMVGWIHWIFQTLFGKSDLVARLPAQVISIWASLLLFYFLIKKGFSTNSSFVGVLALNLTPLFNGISLMFLPDNLLFPLGILIVETCEEIAEKKATTQLWMKLGLLLGIAGLCKYSAVLFLPAILFYFLSFRKRIFEFLFSFKLLVGASIGLTLILPVILWNFNNDFISFKYQTGHLFNWNELSFNHFFQSQAIQFLGWGVGLYLVGFFFFSIDRFKKSLIWWLVSFSLVFFIAVSFGQVLLPHWLVTPISFMIPMGTAFLYERGFKKLIFAACVLSGSISFLLLGELGFKILPSSVTAKAYYDVMGWKADMAAAAQLASDNKADGIAVTNWSLGSRAFYYNESLYPIFVLDQRFDQFNMWNPLSPIGKKILVTLESEKVNEVKQNFNCETWTNVGNLKTMHRETTVRMTQFILCNSFLGFR